MQLEIERLRYKYLHCIIITWNAKDVRQKLVTRTDLSVECRGISVKSVDALILIQLIEKPQSISSYKHCNYILYDYDLEQYESF